MGQTYYVNSLFGGSAFTATDYLSFKKQCLLIAILLFNTLSFYSLKANNHAISSDAFLSMMDCNNDTIPPVITNSPTDVTVNCDNIPPVAMITVTDDCSDDIDIAVETIFEEGSCENAFTLIRRWVVTDEAGNSSSIDQVLNVVDNVRPQLFGVPADIETSCDTLPPLPVVTATDNCDPDLDVIFWETVQTNDCTNGYAMIRNWAVTDACGNFTSATQLITQAAPSPPIFDFLPEDIVPAACGNVPTAPVLTATSCGNPANIDFDEEMLPGTCPGEMAVIRSWTATNACGLITTAAQIVTVFDNESPVMENIPVDLMVNLSAGDVIPAEPVIQAIDNCDDNVMVDFTEEITGTTCNQTITRTWVATDFCGNTSAESQVIMVICSTCTNPEVAAVITEQATCHESNGGIIINMANDPSGYQFDWIPDVSNTFFAENLSAGLYRVFITDINDPSCTEVVEVPLGNSDGPMIESANITPAACQNSDGSIELLPDNFQYTWEDNIVGNARNDLAAGIYIVSIYDATTDCTHLESFTITENNTLETTVTINQLPDCNSSNGSATIAVTGGSGNYTYSWGPVMRDDLPAGVYNVLVTDTDSGCQDNIVFSLSENVIAAQVDIQNDVVELTCPGQLDGTVNFTVTPDPMFNGTPQTMIVDENGEARLNGELTPGDYCIIVRDGGNCIAGQACFEVVAIPAFEVDIATTDKTCGDDGTITVNVSGGTPPYQYDWADLAGNGNPRNRVGLNAGSYTLTIKDANDCELSVDDVLINDVCVPNDTCQMPQVVSLIKDAAHCGLSDGSVMIEMVGNNADYNYEWSPNVSDSNEAHQLVAGIYEVIISKLNELDCRTTLTIVITNADGPEAEISSTTPATCNESNGTAVLNPVNYGYEWCNGLFGFNMNGLPSGTCVVMVTDFMTGCTNFLEVEIPEINVLMTEVDILNLPDCGQANGQVNINVSNGSTDYTYLWDDGNINASRSDLSAGIYQVTVTDNGVTGCTAIVEVVLNNGGIDLATIGIASDSVAVSCAGNTDGMVDFGLAFGGGFVMPDSTVIHDVYGNSVTNGNLGAGDYCILVYDGNQCLAGTSCFQVTAPAPLTIEVVTSDITCDTVGMISVMASGGAGNYTYDWSDLAGTTNPANRDSVDIGSYTVIVTDDNGCTAVAENLMIRDNCINCPVADTASIYLPINNQTEFCVEIESCFDSMTVAFELLDGGFAGLSPNGNWTLAADGCLTYNSGGVAGIGLDTVCIVANDNGLLDTTCVIVTISIDCNIAPTDTMEILTLECDTTVGYCLPIPLNEIQNYAIFDNDEPYAHGIMACEGDTMMMPNTQIRLDTGFHEVKLFDNVTGCADTFFVDVVCVMCPPIYVGAPEILADNCDNGELVCLEIPFDNFIDFEITDNGTVYNGFSAGCNLDTMNVFQGTRIQLDTGLHELIVEDFRRGCIDTFEINVTCIPCLDELYSGDLMLEAETCGDQTEICIDLASGQLSNYEIFDNGVLYTNSLTNCNIDTTIIYDAAGFSDSMIIYTLTSWQVNNNFFSMGQFIGLGELLDSMNVWDPNGNWMLVNNNEIIGGDLSNDYNDMVISQGNIVIATAQPGLILTPEGSGILLDTGFHEIILLDSIGGCQDTFNVFIDCDDFVPDPTDTLTLNILVGFTDTLCFQQIGLPDPLDTIYNICPDSSGVFVQFEIDTINHCVSYQGLDIGTDFGCFVVCDEEDHCDTTILQINVYPPTTMTVTQGIFFGEIDQYCIDTTELAGTVDTIYNICPELSGENNLFELVDDTWCVIYESIGLESDTACIVICDDNDICDTTILAINNVTLSGDLPIAIDDDTLTIINTPFIIDVLSNDIVNGPFISVELETDAPNGSAVIDPATNGFIYNPDLDFCGRDSFTYMLNTGTGSDIATVFIEVLCDELVIYNGMSPNGDGVNDEFVILGIERYPENTVRVFNRWGNQVFMRQGYSNSDAWRGDWKGSDLPDGTYFYQIDTGEGDEITGYLQIHR